MTRATRHPTAIVRINLFLTGALLLIALSTHAMAQGPVADSERHVLERISAHGVTARPQAKGNMRADSDVPDLSAGDAQIEATRPWGQDPLISAGLNESRLETKR